MFTEASIEALLVDEELADLVWQAWVRDLIDDELATIAWLLIVNSSVKRPCRRDHIPWAYVRPMPLDQ